MEKINKNKEEEKYLLEKKTNLRKKKGKKGEGSIAQQAGKAT